MILRPLIRSAAFRLGLRLPPRPGSGTTPLVFLAMAFALLATPLAAETTAGRATGLPLPRFVSLAADQVNLRYGPGEIYPILWILAREGLPVEIVEEFDTWRKVRLHDGDVGWIHSGLLSSRRTALVMGETRALRQSPDPAARIVLRAEPGVIGELIDCDGAWCRIEIDGRRGWLERDSFWGVLPDETLH